MTRSQVKPANYKKAEYQNVLHLTIGGDSQQNGDRTPAVWIHPEKGILISSSVNGTSDYGFFCLQHLPKGGPIKMGICLIFFFLGGGGSKRLPGWLGALI